MKISRTVFYRLELLRTKKTVSVDWLLITIIIILSTSRVSVAKNSHISPDELEAVYLSAGQVYVTWMISNEEFDQIQDKSSLNYYFCLRYITQSCTSTFTVPHKGVTITQFDDYVRCEYFISMSDNDMVMTSTTEICLEIRRANEITSNVTCNLININPATFLTNNPTEKYYPRAIIAAGISSISAAVWLVMISEDWNEEVVINGNRMVEMNAQQRQAWLQEQREQHEQDEQIRRQHEVNQRQQQNEASDDDTESEDEWDEDYSDEERPLLGEREARPVVNSGLDCPPD